MGRGAWWATVHGVTRSETRLKRLSIWGKYVVSSYMGALQRFTSKLCPRELSLESQDGRVGTGRQARCGGRRF